MQAKVQFLKGFTLVEIMIVMVLLGLIMGLIGPMTINQLNKTKAKSELLTFKTKLTAISTKAALMSKPIQITLNGKEMIVSHGEVKISQGFENLFFDPQILMINKNGYVFPDFVTAKYRDESLKLDLNKSINKLEKLQGGLDAG